MAGTGGQPASGGVSGVAGARATGGTSGAAGASNGVGGSGGSLPPVYVSYSFDQTAGPALTDESGNGRGGALEGAATFATGIVRNALELDGTAGSYVRLPAGLVATLRDATIAFWVRPRANASSSTAWQRVFDFGVNTTKYMFFTSYSINYSGVKVARFGSPSAATTTSRGSTPIAAAGRHVDACRHRARRERGCPLPQRRRERHEPGGQVAANRPGDDRQ